MNGRGGAGRLEQVLQDVGDRMSKVHWTTDRGELVPLLRLAGPVVLAEIGWMAMGIADTIMVGPLGPAAIGAAGMASSIFLTIGIFGMGVMLGLDALVSQAHGARQPDECMTWLQHGIVLAIVAAPVLMGVTYGLLLTVDAWRLHAEVEALAIPYLRVVTLSTLPLLFYATFRRYLQGIHVVRPVMHALVSANLINVAANWVLIYGRLGFPRLGVEGAAWATCIARTYMAAFLVVAILREHRRRGIRQPRRLHVMRARLVTLLALGVPAALQVTLEVGVFAAVSALAARLDPVSSGSHQIALNVAALAFMMPLGLSSATAVRVGYGMGAASPRRAARAGWIAIATGIATAAIVAVVFILIPVPILRLFTDDGQVLATGVGLLAVAAAFQVFDGTQAIATGALRGIGDTHTPVVANVLGHWLFGLPAGYALCFWSGWGVQGLWIGLSIGLMLVAIALTVVWLRRTRGLASQDTTIPAPPDTKVTES